MFELWTNLLISAIESEREKIFLSSYIGILKQLSALEARILNYIYEEEEDINIKDNNVFKKVGLHSEEDQEVLNIATSNLCRLELIYDIGKVLGYHEVEQKLRDIGEDFKRNESLAPTCQLIRSVVIN